MTGDNWIEVGKTDSIDIEDLIRFDHGADGIGYPVEIGRAHV